MTQDRRKDEQHPTQPLVFTDEKLITAAQGHLRAECIGAFLLPLPGTDPVAYVAAGTKDALRGLLRDDPVGDIEVLAGQDWNAPVAASSDPEGTPLYAGPVEREGQAEAVIEIRNAAYERAASLCDRFAARDMHPTECAGAIRMMKAKAPAAPSEPTMTCPQCGVDRLKSPCPGMADECAMIADAHLLTAAPSERAQEGQQDQAVDDLTIQEILEIHDANTDRDFGLIVEPFARAIEAEVQRRCRAQRTTIEESKVAAEDAREWISVDERLPEDNQTVAILFWPYSNRENPQIAGAAEHVEGTFYTDEGYEHHAPSHWTPLPAIPDRAAITASDDTTPAQENQQ